MALLSPTNVVAVTTPDRTSHLKAVANVARAGVATAFRDATRAAAEILAAGGNAADAAVAAAWAIAVCEPSGSGIGGQTTVLLRRADGSLHVIDGHSWAPMSASRRSISRREQHFGRKATTVPSTPAVLDLLGARFGRLSRTAVMAPAIRLATDGYTFTKRQRREAKWCWKDLVATGAHTIFENRRGRLLDAGASLRQPRLAATLERLARDGSADFYRGALARSIVNDMATHGGLLAAEDLNDARFDVTDRVVSIDVHGHRIVSPPPPGGGATLLQTLRLLAELSPAAADEPAFLADVGEAVFAAFSFRERWPIRAHEFTSAMRQWMLGDAQIAEQAAAIRAAVPLSTEGGDEPPGDTSHLCVADAEGNVVALTQSIQSLFGSKVAHPALGFFYNNYLTTSMRQQHPQALGPRSMPRSNVCPVLALDDTGQPRLAAGAAGSRRIVSAVAQVLHRVLVRGEDIAAAVSAPRAHAVLNGKLWIEQPGLTETLQAHLQRRWARVIAKRPHDYSMGCVQALSWDATGAISAAADPRRDGSAVTLTADGAEA